MKSMGKKAEGKFKIFLVVIILLVGLYFGYKFTQERGIQFGTDDKYIISGTEKIYWHKISSSGSTPDYDFGGQLTIDGAGEIPYEAGAPLHSECRDLYENTLHDYDSWGSVQALSIKVYHRKQFLVGEDRPCFVVTGESF